FRSENSESDRIQIDVATSSISAASAERCVGRVGQQHSGEARKDEEVVYLQAVHSSHDQRSSVTEDPCVDVAWVICIFKDIPKHLIEEISQRYVIFGMVDVHPDIESADEQILRGGSSDF